MTNSEDSRPKPDWAPLTPLNSQIQGPLLRGEDMALSQVGWLGASGRVYGLHDTELARGMGDSRYSPLYVQLGTFKIDAEGQLNLVE